MLANEAHISLIPIEFTTSFISEDGYSVMEQKLKDKKESTLGVFRYTWMLKNELKNGLFPYSKSSPFISPS